MATWNDLKTYIRNNYKVADERENAIKLIFDVGGLRSQVVLIWHVPLQGSNDDWIQIESPIGELGQIDLAAALHHVGGTVVGGLALAVSDNPSGPPPLVTFRHSVPLDDLSINEFEAPLALVTSTADRLEQALTGGDTF